MAKLLGHLTCLLFFLNTRFGVVTAEGSKIEARLVGPSTNLTNESVRDYYVGPVYMPPSYTQEYLEHLNAIEVEYFEFFSQLRPASGSRTILSPCLRKREFPKISINEFKKGVRRLPGALKHEIDNLLGRPPRKPAFPNFCFTSTLSINVYYHIVSSTFDDFSKVKPELLDAQHDYLNQVFGERLDIQFVKQDVNYRIDKDFANHEASFRHPFRRNTHSGNYWDINVWIVESTWDEEGDNLNGYAFFPNASLNNYERTFDGIVIRAGTMNVTDSAMQRTLLHEIGHWLGLKHVFAEDNDNFNKSSCTNTNTDEISDTQQFPHHKAIMFERMQIPCGGEEEVLVTNFMSYSTARGEDEKSFTDGQKARVFSRYLGERLGLKNMQNCKLRPKSTKRALPDKIVELLIEDNADCWADWNSSPEIDFSSLPSPDPEWVQYPVLVGPRNPEPPHDMFEGVASSCNCPNHDGISSSPDSKTNPTPVPIPETCPKSCNVHSNTCHQPTAQTCIYPNPFVPNPRAACACKPGYRAAGAVDDVSRHWRLPVPGLEDFVWVAEGVECNTKCYGAPGTPVCREVTVVDGKCVSL